MVLFMWLVWLKVRQSSAKQMLQFQFLRSESGMIGLSLNGQWKFLQCSILWFSSVCVCCPSNALRLMRAKQLMSIDTKPVAGSSGPSTFLSQIPSRKTRKAPPKSIKYKCLIWVDALSSLGETPFFSNISCTSPPPSLHSVVCHRESSPTLLAWHCLDLQCSCLNTWPSCGFKSSSFFRFRGAVKLPENFQKDLILQLLQLWHPKNSSGDVPRSYRF